MIMIMCSHSQNIQNEIGGVHPDTEDTQTLQERPFDIEHAKEVFAEVNKRFNFARHGFALNSKEKNAHTNGASTPVKM